GAATPVVRTAASMGDGYDSKCVWIKLKIDQRVGKPACLQVTKFAKYDRPPVGVVKAFVDRVVDCHEEPTGGAMRLPTIPTISRADFALRQFVDLNVHSSASMLARNSLQDFQPSESLARRFSSASNCGSSSESETPSAGWDSSNRAASSSR